MKPPHIMEEFENSIEDKNDRSNVLGGLLGYILSSTQVCMHIYKFSIHIYIYRPGKDYYICAQEAAVVPPYVAFAVRPNPGFSEFVKVNTDDLEVDGITVTEFLKFKEMIYDENWY